MYVYHMHIWNPQRPGNGTRAPGLELEIYKFLIYKNQDGSFHVRPFWENHQKSLYFISAYISRTAGGKGCIVENGDKIASGRLWDPRPHG